MKEDLPNPAFIQQEASKTQEEEASNAEHTEQALKQAQEDLAAANDKYLRLYSEFDNFRRRAAKEKLSLIETAGEDIIKKLLPIADDFERALEAFQAADTAAAPQATQEGVRLIYEKLVHLLQQAGVQLMPLDKGTVFDTELHEAVTQMSTEDQGMQGKVLEVLEKGYLLNEKVLRFAKVVTGA
jgi:molecular chaperone GrpE